MWSLSSLVWKSRLVVKLQNVQVALRQHGVTPWGTPLILSVIYLPWGNPKVTGW